MNRICILLAMALLLVSTAKLCRAESVVLDVEKMKVALHVSEEQNQGFIEYVVARAKAGTLPIDLVESTFLWAIRKPHKKFYYFKYGLIERAKQRGITL
ncbi:MAG: hypothetical protein JW959_10975 [Pirellulales bacterium]|nr:hypothetical protein [Pirellulales bacterium]